MNKRVDRNFNVNKSIDISKLKQNQHIKQYVGINSIN